MRAPDIKPRRRRPGANLKILLAGLAAVVLVLLISLRGIAGFYTDYLFFKELGFEDVWRDLIVAKALPAVVFTVVFFVLVLVNLIIADRLAPRFRPAGPEEELVARYRAIVGPYAGRVRVGVAAVLAVIAGGGLSGHWNEWILFRNRVDFGEADAQFGTDIGFYVFTMPFLRFVFEWAFAAVVIAFIVTAVAHYLNGGIRLQAPLQRVTPQVKAHLSVLLGAVALLKAFGYWLERYDLNFSTRGAVGGASYTDVKAQLPALNMLIVISIAAAVLLIVNIRLRGWVLPVIAVGLWSFVSVAIGGLYPLVIQRFSVEPNEFQKEEPYIKRNITATRLAFGLDKVETRVFDPSTDLTAEDIRANEATIGDARLWDPDVLDDTYRQLQQIRQLYDFRDVDIDRYSIDGEIRQIFLAARELNVDELPSKTWQNQHLVYTHGYGVVASASNEVTDQQEPDFLIKDIPGQSDTFDLTQPRFYYGEALSGFALVNTKQREFDFPKEPEDATTVYEGDGGVKISNILRRAAFALRFGDTKMLISNQISADSKVLFVRDIRERVRKAAPFLRFDADPYPVILNKRVLWVIDAYTATDRYPYAEAYQPGPNRLDERSGLQTRLNYVRNSVKATVDAYDGTVQFYVFDDKENPDPIVAAYRKAFPDLFDDRSEMPDGLVEHLRYPEDLFRVQTDTYARYHLTSATNFYRNSGRWVVAQDPGSGVLAFDNPTTPVTTRSPVNTAPGRVPVEPTRAQRMDPYYLLMRLPGQTKESFLILQPFVPAPSGGQQEPKALASFMVAKSDPGEYGQLEAYTIPVNESFLGPDQINSIITADPAINLQLSNLNRSGAQIVQGSLQLIPTADSILYVRPLYLQGAGGTKLPKFQFVAVVYNGEAVLGKTLDEALAQLFPGLSSGVPPGPGEAPEPGGETPPTATDVVGLLAEADQAFTDAQAALKEGKLGDYQRLIDRVGVLIDQARTAGGAAEVPAEPASASTTTTTAPGEP